MSILDATLQVRCDENLELIGGAKTLGDLVRLVQKSSPVKLTFEEAKVYALRKVAELEASGKIYLSFACEDKKLKRTYDRLKRGCKSFAKDVWNVVGEEMAWRTHPTDMDFLSRDSDFYELKQFEKEVYLDIFRPYLARLKKNSLILDAGGGIGRFTFELAKRGHEVHLLDSCESSLKVALRRAIEENVIGLVDLHWGDVNNLSMFPDNQFDAALAIEVICYCTSPARALRELVRVVRNGGFIFLSVEGKYGAMLADLRIGANEFKSVYSQNELCVKHEIYARYYTRDEFENLLRRSGIRVFSLHGCHYVADGVLHRFFEGRLNGGWRERLLTIEKMCREDPVLRDLARVWVAVGRV